MGDALIVTRIPEEALMLESLYDVNEQLQRVPIADLYPVDEWQRLRQNRSELLRRHPNAFYLVEVRDQDVWENLPEEPWRQLGLDWHKKKGERKKHSDVVRKSLEDFINRQLAGLYRRVRTGWWVLGRVRVRVAECRPVPEREMRAFARAFLGKKVARKQRP